MEEGPAPPPPAAAAPAADVDVSPASPDGPDGGRPPLGSEKTHTPGDRPADLSPVVKQERMSPRPERRGEKEKGKDSRKEEDRAEESSRREKESRKEKDRAEESSRREKESRKEKDRSGREKPTGEGKQEGEG